MRGERGFSGAGVPGAPGLKGDPGEPGSAGSPGAQGPKGDLGDVKIDGLLVSGLTSRTILSATETVFTVGLSAADDNGGGMFYGVIGSTATTYPGMVYTAPNGRYFRITPGDVLNLCWFGARAAKSGESFAAALAAGDFLTALSNARAWAFNGVSAGTDASAIYILPQAEFSYPSSGPIVPLPGNHRQEVIRGEGSKPYCSVSSRYGASDWLSTSQIGGAVIQFAPNQNGVNMIANFGDAGSTYRRMRLENLAIQCSGTGKCVNMDSDDVANSCGRLELSHVMLAGGAVGWRHRSYELSGSDNVIIRGCGVAWDLQGGAAQTIHNLDIQGCDTPVHLWNALGSGYHVTGTCLIQSNYKPTFRAPEGASIGRLVFDCLHNEGIDNDAVGVRQWVDIHSSVSTLNVTIKNGHATDSDSWEAVLRGNGWRLENFGFGGKVKWQNGALSTWSDCAPEDEDWTNQLAQPIFIGPKTPYVQAGVTGTLQLNRRTHGNIVELEVQGNVTLPEPEWYPVGSSIFLTAFQGSSGGWGFTFAGTWYTKRDYNNRDNVAGNIGKFTFRRALDGHWILAAFSGWMPLSGAIGTGAQALDGLFTTGLSSRAGLVQGEFVLTQGYSGANDNGGGEFRFYSGAPAFTADGFTTINCPNGQYRMVEFETLYTEQFGFKADHQKRTDGITYGASNQLGISDSTRPFTPADVGKSILVRTPLNPATGTFTTSLGLYYATGTGSALQTQINANSELGYACYVHGNYHAITNSGNDQTTLFLNPVAPAGFTGATAYLQTQLETTITAVASNGLSCTLAHNTLLAQSGVYFSFGTVNNLQTVFDAAVAVGCKEIVMQPGDIGVKTNALFLGASYLNKLVPPRLRGTSRTSTIICDLRRTSYSAQAQPYNALVTHRNCKGIVVHSFSIDGNLPVGAVPNAVPGLGLRQGISNTDCSDFKCYDIGCRGFGTRDEFIYGDGSYPNHQEGWEVYGCHIDRYNPCSNNGINPASGYITGVRIHDNYVCSLTQPILGTGGDNSIVDNDLVGPLLPGYWNGGDILVVDNGTKNLVARNKIYGFNQYNSVAAIQVFGGAGTEYGAAHTDIYDNQIYDNKNQWNYRGAICISNCPGTFNIDRNSFSDNQSFADGGAHICIGGGAATSVASINIGAGNQFRSKAGQNMTVGVRVESGYLGKYTVNHGVAYGEGVTKPLDINSAGLRFSGAAKRVKGDPLDVYDFPGSDVTTKALNAIAAARNEANLGGMKCGDVRFPAGEHIIEATLLISGPNDGQVSIRGMGANANTNQASFSPTNYLNGLGGTVLRVAAGVNGIQADNFANVRLRDFVLVGPGTGTTKGVYVSGAEFSLQRLSVANFSEGIHIEDSVSSHLSQWCTVRGNQIGLRLGNWVLNQTPTMYQAGTVTDSVFEGFTFEANDVAIQLEICQGISFTGRTLVQSNTKGVRFGDVGGGCDAVDIGFSALWFESNTSGFDFDIVAPYYAYTGNTTSGNAAITGMSSTTGLRKGMSVVGSGVPGGAKILSVSGSTVTLTANVTATATGVGLTFTAANINGVKSRAYKFSTNSPGKTYKLIGANWDCDYWGPGPTIQVATAGYSASAVFKNSSPSLVVNRYDSETRVQRYGGSGPNVFSCHETGGTYNGTLPALDLLNEGPTRLYQINGNFTLPLPVNAQRGDEVTIILQQVSAGGYTGTLNASYKMLSGGYSDTGNVAGAYCVLCFVNVANNWVQKYPAAWHL